MRPPIDRRRNKMSLPRLPPVDSFCLEPTASFHLDRSISGVSGVQLKATLRKQLQHEAQLEFAGVEEAFAQEKSQILTRTNREVLRAREDGQKELQLVVQSSKRQMDDALRAQERLIMEKCEREKREMEIRWASERNALERAFAEEKMAMMSRLQEDFNMELRRTRMSSSVESVNSRGSQDKVAELTKQLKVLESSLNGQRNGYETKIEEIRHECDRQLAELRKQLDQQKAWSTAEDLPPRLSKLFYALLDDYKNRERAKLARDRDDFLDGLQNERAKLCESLENEKQRMTARHASQIEEMRRRADEQTALLDETRTECQNLRADLASIRSSSTDSARGDRPPVLFGEANTQTDEDDLPLVFPSSLSFPTTVADSTVQTNETLISISTTPTTSLASRFNHFVVDADGGNVRPSRCAKCELVESRIKDIELAVQSDSAFESGVEDLGSSAESLEDANLLKRENGKMRRKLGLARQRLTDLRLCMTVSSSQEIRRRCAPNTFNIAAAAALNGEWLPVAAAVAGRNSKSANAAYYEAAAVETSVGSEMERLQVENVLVDARLQETRALLQETVKKYQEQLRETGRLGLLIRRLCSSRKTM
uniref:Uncharacterized protein n=1 Tax=Plectus sambesii TaxID=2011161 RepID=A0A914WFM3_9BILA